MQGRLHLVQNGINSKRYCVTSLGCRSMHALHTFTDRHSLWHFKNLWGQPCVHVCLSAAVLRTYYGWSQWNSLVLPTDWNSGKSQPLDVPFWYIAAGHPFLPL